jgi:cyclopropane-fatty-acyl-phospholipid synthase
MTAAAPSALAAPVETLLRAAVAAGESGLVPDPVTRFAIRRLCAQRLREERRRADADRHRDFLHALRRGPIALHVDAANAQHYALPPAFFHLVLGARRKYSCAFWPDGVHDLDRAEEAMLDLTCRRAGLQDGMRVLDLGCGWGSLALWIAERYPRCRVLAVSNSLPQGEFIRAELLRRGLGGVDVLTADINDLDPGERFDCILSVEMFEHLRNYQRLLHRLAGWLAPGGRLFVHVFAHRAYCYPYEPAGEADWMARTFFTGGLMPSHDLLAHFQDDLRLEDQWWLGGRHYQRTSNAWLRNLDARRDRVLPLLAETYGVAEARRWLVRWRLFFLACAELFGFRRGREWGVTHLRFARRADG